MKGKGPVVTVALALLAGMPALGQSDDPAAERARLANQRIQAEAQRQAEIEEERRRQEAAKAQRSAPQANAPNVDTPATDAPPGRADMYRVLEQLRELGELKDAGYLTDDEFSALKEKILDGVR